MTPGRGIVLDANILIRAVPGKRVRALLEAYEDAIAFYTPDVCFDDPRKYIRGYSTAAATTRKPAWRCSIGSGCSSSRWIKLHIGISSN
jgi:hypothetical protein